MNSGNATLHGSSYGINNSVRFTVVMLAAFVIFAFGTLHAIAAPAFAASNPVVDTGQSEAFTANIPLGSGISPYTFNVYIVSSLSCSTLPSTAAYSQVTPSNSVTFSNIQTTTSGTYYYCATVTDSNSISPETNTSAPISIIINPQLTVSITSPTSPQTINGPITITASSTGGTSPVSYSWIGSRGSNCLGFSNPGNTDSFTYTPTGPTPGCTFEVTATDAAATPETASATTPVLTIPKLQIVSFTISNTSMDLGQSETFTAQVSGGISPYNFGILSPACGLKILNIFTSPSNTYSNVYTSPKCAIGTDQFKLTASDSANPIESLTENQSITAYSTPSVSGLQPSNSSLDYGQHVTYTATISGGSGNFDAVLVDSSNTPVVSLTNQKDGPITFPSFEPSKGSQTYTVYVTDVGTTTHYSLAPESSTIQVNGTLQQPLINFTEGSSPIDNGQYVVISCKNCDRTSLQGSGAYHYQWLVGYESSAPNPKEAITMCGATSTTLSCDFNTSGNKNIGNYTIELQVTDSASTPQTTLSNSTNVTVNPAMLAPEITPSSIVAIQGSMTKPVSAVLNGGGTPPYRFVWYINGNPINCNAILPVAGFYCKASTNAYKNDTLEFSANASMIGNDTIETAVVDSSNGLPNYPAGSLCKVDIARIYMGILYLNCSGADLTFGNFNLSYTDAIVLPTLQTHSITPNDTSPLQIDNGQSLHLTEAVTGGSAPYTYSWYLNNNPGSSDIFVYNTSFKSSNTILFNGNASTLDTFTGGLDRLIVCVDEGPCGASTGTFATSYLNVHPSLGIPSIAAVPSTSTVPLVMDVGQKVILNASETGGTGSANYTYTWYDNGNPITACPTSSSPKCTYLASTPAASSGTLNDITVKVTDTGTDPSATPTPPTATSQNFAITVYPSLGTPTIAPTGVKMDQGQSVTFTASETGGTGSSNYVYTWYDGATVISGCTSSACTYATTTSTSTGTHDITVNVRDSGTTTPPAEPPANMTSAVDAVTVNMPLNAGSISITGGTGANCTALPSCINYAHATSSSTTMDQNSGAIISDGSVSGGTTPYSYQWVAEAPGQTSYTASEADTLCGSSAQSTTCNFLTTTANPIGTYKFELQVTDSAYSPSVATTSSPVTITLNAAAITSPILSNALVIDEGQSFVLSDIMPTAGTPSYYASWKVNSQTISSSYCSSLGLAAGYNTTCTVSTPGSITLLSGTQPLNPGTYQFGLSIGDSEFQSLSIGYIIYDYQAAGNTVTINPALGITANANASSMHADQAVLLYNTTTGGTPSYSYQWYVEAPGATKYTAIAGATSNTFKFDARTMDIATGGAYKFMLQVTDSASHPVILNSTPVTVDVNATFAVPKLVLWVHGNIINDADSANHGNWALDTITRTIRAYQTGIRSFDMNFSDKGTAYTFAGVSSPGSGTLEPYNGNAPFTGYDNLTFNGTFTPGANAVSLSNASIGTLNEGGSITGNVISAGISTFDHYIYSYFTLDASYSYTKWGDTYTYGVYPLSGQSWIDSSSKIAGDIITYQAPAVNMSAPSNSVLDAGQYETYTATVYNGIGPFSVELMLKGSSSPVDTQTVYANTTGNVGSNTVTFNFQPPQGIDTYYINVMDNGASGYTFNSVSNTVVVNAAPQSTTSANPVSIHADQQSEISGVVTGGTSPFAYQWYIEVPGNTIFTPIPKATATTFAFNSLNMTTGGKYTFELVTSDSASIPETFNSVVNATVTVNAMYANPVLEAYVHANVVNDEDSSAYGYWGLDNFTRTIIIHKIGMQSYMVNLVDTGNTFIPQGGLSPGSASVTEPYDGLASLTGKQTITLNGTLAGSASFPLTSSNSFLGKVNFGGNVKDILLRLFSNGQKGDILNVTSPVLGEPSFDYFLNGYFTGITNVQQPNNWTYSYYYGTYPTSGQTYTDAASGITGNIITYQAPAVTMSAPSNSVLDFGQYETYTATVYNGIGPFSVELMLKGSSSPVNTQTVYANTIGNVGSNTVTFNFQPPQGTDTYYINVMDNGASGYTFNSVSNTVVVNAAPQSTTSANPVSIHADQQSEISGVVTGGTSPFAYQWYIEVPGNTIFTPIPKATATTFAFNSLNMTTGGTYAFELVTSDSASIPETFNSVVNATVTVNAMYANPDLLVHVHGKVVNDEDSAFSGYWGVDNFTRSIYIWQRGIGFYSINYTDHGTTYIPAGAHSPNAGIKQPYTGNATMFGVQNITFNGTFDPKLPVVTDNASIPTLNEGNRASAIANVINNIGPGTLDTYQYYINQYFSKSANENWPGGYGGYYYSYTYGTYPPAPNEQVWVDAGNVAQANSGEIVTYMTPNAIMSAPSNSVLDSGQYETYTATVYNGIGTFSVNLMLQGMRTPVKTEIVTANGIGNTGGNTATFTFQPPQGTDTYYVNVVDNGASGYTFDSATNTVVVNAALAASATASNSSIHADQESTLSGSTTGGTLPLSYQWFIEDPSSAAYKAIPNANSVAFVFNSLNMTTGGTYNFKLQVTDSASLPVVVNSISVPVTVNAMFKTPKLVIYATANIINDEDSGNVGYWAMDNYFKVIKAWQTGISASTAAYPSNTYMANVTYTGRWNTFAGALSPGLGTIEPYNGAGTMVGGYNIIFSGVFAPGSNAVVTDGSLLGTFNDQGSVSDILKGKYVNGQTGDAKAWDWIASYFPGYSSSSIKYLDGGNAWGWTYNYNIYPNTGQNTAGQNWVNAVGGGGDIVTYRTPSVVLAAPSNSTLDYGQTETYNTTVYNGIGPFRVQLFMSGDTTPLATVTLNANGIGNNGGVTTTFTFKPPQGTDTYHVAANDLGSTPGAVAPANYLFTSQYSTITVNKPLGIPTITPNGPTIDSGQSITFTANENDGTTPYSYKWFVDGTSEGTNSASFTMTPSMYGSASHANVSVMVTDSATTPETQTSANDVVTINPPLTAPGIQLSGNKFDQEETGGTVYAEPPTGGTPPYTYTYIISNASSGAFYYECHQSLSKTCAIPTDRPGNYTVNVIATDNAHSPESTNSLPANFVVNPTFGFNPSTTGSPLVILNKTVVPYAGDNILISANLIGGPGTPPYVYSYSIFNATTGKKVGSTVTEDNGLATNSIVYTPTENGIYYAAVTMSDNASAPFVTTGKSLYFMVGSGKPTVTASIYKNTIDSGTNEPITLEVLGGIGPFNVEFYNITGGTPVSSVLISAPGGTNTIIYSAEKVGTFAYNVIAVDTGNSGYTFNSQPYVMTVAPPLGSLLSSSNSIVDQGMTTTLTAEIHGGTPPYTFTFGLYDSANYLVATNMTKDVMASDPSNVMMPTSVSASFTSNVFYPTGNYVINAIITDNGFGQETLTNTIMVNSDPSITIAASKSKVEAGQPVTFTNTTTGGTPPYTFSYNVIGGNYVINGNSILFEDVGNYSITENVTDSLGFSVQSKAVNVTVTSAPVVAISGTTSATVGDSISFAATVNDVGSGNDIYQWYNDSASTPVAISGANAITFTETAGATGTFRYYIEVTDLNNGTGISNVASVTVSSKQNTPPGTVTSSGGGGGGGGGGGNFVPTVLSRTSGSTQCVTIYNFSQDNSEKLHILNNTLDITENYITPSTAGISINGNVYELAVNQTESAGRMGNVNYTVQLTHLSYLPIIDTVTVVVCGTGPAQTPLAKPNVTSNSTGTTNTTVTKPKLTTSVPTTTVAPKTPSKLTQTNTTSTGIGSVLGSSTFLLYGILALIILALIMLYAYSQGMFGGKSGKPKGKSGK